MSSGGLPDAAKLLTVPAYPPSRPVEQQQLLTAATEDVAAALENGAEVDAPDDTGSTALMLPAERGNSIAMAALLMAGADIEAVTPLQVTATMRAARAGQMNGR